MSEIITEKRRGRPATRIEWPTTEFTVNDLTSQLNGQLSKVSIQLRIHQAIENGELMTVGERKMKGRPSMVYSKNVVPILES